MRGRAARAGLDSSASAPSAAGIANARFAAARDRAVDSERLAALLRIAERGGQQAERGRRQQRAERALQRAGADEHGEGLGGAAGRGGGGEAEQAGDQRALAAEQVAELAAEQQQAAERQRVAGDDPLARVVGEAQVVLRGRQRDVHDRRVEHDHQLRHAEDREDPPAAVGLGVVGRHARLPGRSGGVAST
jgi:hypothetical protein